MKSWLRVWLCFIVLRGLTSGVGAQWVAFNDHVQGANSSTNCTFWNVFTNQGGAPGKAGYLKNIATGAPLPVWVSINNAGADGGTTAGAPAYGTPASNAFPRGIIDFGSTTGANTNHAIQVAHSNGVAYVFTNLNVSKVYHFTATAIRGGAYPTRWTLCELLNARAFGLAHSAGVLTSNQSPATLGWGQAAFNSGSNNTATLGDLVSWTGIVPIAGGPGTNGTFTVRVTQYTNTIPAGYVGGPGVGDATRYAYAFNCFRLEEIVTNTPPQIMAQPESFPVLEGTTASLWVTALGLPAPSYQWYFNNTNALPKATNACLNLEQVQLGQAGSYSVRVSNALGGIVSSNAVVDVLPLSGLRFCGDWPGYHRGSARKVQVVGARAYVAEYGAGLAVYEVSNPSNIVRLGGYDTPGYASSVKVVSNLAYVADAAGGLHILEVSNPTNITRLGGSTTLGSAYDVQVVGPLVYVAVYSAGLQVFDAHDPAQVVSVGSYDTPGNAYGVQVVGNRAYVADYAAGLQILDVSDPVHIVLLGSYDTPGNAMAVQVVGTRAYVADGSRGLQVLEVSDPANIVRLGEYNTPGTSYDVQVTNPVVYLADSSSGLQVLDASNPANIILLTSFDTPGSAYGLCLVNERLYLADYAMGWAVLDVHRPMQPVRLGGTIPGNMAYDVQMAGYQAVVPDMSAGTQLLDLSATNAVWRTNLYSSGWNSQCVQVVGRRAYLLDFNLALQVFDLSNPAAPVYLGGYDTGTYADGLCVVGDRAYVAGRSEGLHILDVSNPAAIIRLGGYDTAGWAEGVYVVGNRAYVADYTSGLAILDVSNPTNVVLLGSYDTPGNAYKVQVVGTLAFVADGTSGLQILEVSNPAAIIRLGTYDTPGLAYDLQVVGNLAYVADTQGGLQVLEVSNPTRILSAGVIPPKEPLSGSGVSAVTIIGNLALMANREWGISVQDLGPLAPYIPGIAAAPFNLTVSTGAVATFSVIGYGQPPLSYQWLIGGKVVPGATNSTLVLSNAQPADVVDYAVIVGNAYGAVTSSTATLKLTLTGLVSCWDGEGNANDSAGSYHGTLKGTVAFTNGPVGRAFVLNGANSYVDVATSPALDLLPAITLTAWFNLDQLPSKTASIRTIAAKSMNGCDFDLQVMNNNRLRFYPNFADSGSEKS